MISFRNFSRSALMAAAVAASMAAVPTASMAGVGLVTPSDLYGNWVATLQGLTGCGHSAMHVAINMNASGTGTANLTCGAGCGWNLRVQVSPDRGVMNLIDVDRANPGIFCAGVGVHSFPPRRAGGHRGALLGVCRRSFRWHTPHAARRAAAPCNHVHGAKQ